ncbi:hypothetical protein Tco_1307001, partial [Tanacetum coccineum]
MWGVGFRLVTCLDGCGEVNEVESDRRGEIEVWRERVVEDVQCFKNGAVAVSDEPGDGSRVHTHDHDGSAAPDESLDSILLSEPKPLGKHRPPPPPSILISLEMGLV